MNPRIRRRAAARWVRPWVGCASMAVLTACLSACGGGGDSPAQAPADPVDRAGAQDVALAQAMSVTATSDVVSGPGWVVAPPKLPASTASIGDTSAYAASVTAGANVYHVSAQGNDRNPGTAALPWRTLAPATEVLAGGAPRIAFKAGDAILLKCGDVWRNGEMVLGRANNPSIDNGLLLGAYGCDGSKPRPLLSGASDLPKTAMANWSETRSGVQAIALSAPIKRLYVDGVPATPARYPNGAAGRQFAKATLVEPVSGHSEAQRDDRNRRYFKITGADLDFVRPHADDVPGARVHIRTTTYTTETAVIQAFDPASGLVTLETQPGRAHPLAHPIMQDAGYVLSGKGWLVDAPGEWFQDGSNVLLYGSSAAPSGVFTAAVQRKTSGTTPVAKPSIGLWLYQVSNLTIEHLGMAYNDQNLNLSVGNNVVIRDVVSLYADEDGLAIDSAPNTQVLNNRVDHSGLNGIRFSESAGVLVKGNVVTGTGIHRLGERLADGLVKEGDRQNIDLPVTGFEFTGWGIRVRGANSVVDGNYVLDSANAGIAFSDRLLTQVINNTVINACKLKTDCGAIYTSNDAWPTQNLQEITSLIHKNIVAGLVSNLDGAPIYGVRKLTAGENQANGIYLDDKSATINVSENVVVGAEVGIYLHNSAYNVVSKNVTRSIGHASLLVSNDSKEVGDKGQAPAWVTRGNQIVGNMLFSRRTVDLAAFAQTPFMGVRGKSTYAQLWLNSSANASVFFQDTAAGANDRNVSLENSARTLNEVSRPAIWRMESPDRRDVALAPVLEQVSGAVWGTRSFTEPHVEMGMQQWWALAGSSTGKPDTESSPVAYRTHRYAAGNQVLSTLTSSDWKATAGTKRNLSSYYCPLGLSCVEYTATGAGDRLTSNTVSLAAGTLYAVGYSVKAATADIRHSAHIGLSGAGASQVQMVVTPLMSLKGGSTPGVAEDRRIETLLRPAQAIPAATLSLRGSDGSAGYLNKKLYFSNASLTSVSGVSVLPDMSKLGVAAINATDTDRQFSCAELGFADTGCMSSLTTYGSSTVTSLKVTKRGSTQFHVKSADWQAPVTN